jgi:hypothetical protein
MAVEFRLDNVSPSPDTIKEEMPPANYFGPSPNPTLKQLKTWTEQKQPRAKFCE